MVANATGLTANGVRDWLIQRTSALVLGIYTLFLLIYIILHPNLQYADWHALFSHIGMQVVTIIVLLSLILHAWMGVWTVFTDYIKCPILRGSLQVLVVLALLSVFVYGVIVLMI